MAAATFSVAIAIASGSVTTPAFVAWSIASRIAS
jgi:hypothetical protein